MQTVLVVDDEAVLREVVAEALRDEGFAVSVANDGAAALELVAQSPPDLVLMDVMMPGMDGREAYLALRSRADLPQVPVVLMSAAIHSAGLDPSIDGYLPKPFDIDALVALVQRLVGPAG